MVGFWVVAALGVVVGFWVVAGLGVVVALAVVVAFGVVAGLVVAFGVVGLGVVVATVVGVIGSTCDVRRKNRTLVTVADRFVVLASRIRGPRPWHDDDKLQEVMRC